MRPLRTIGAGVHTDYGNLTLLATDDVGGLEVRTRAGELDRGAALPGAFVVNIGDCLMRWTNDVYVSTPHRVVNRSGRERYSIAFFFDPNPRPRSLRSPLASPRASAPASADPRRRLSQVPPRREQARRDVERAASARRAATKVSVIARSAGDEAIHDRSAAPDTRLLRCARNDGPAQNHFPCLSPGNRETVPAFQRGPHAMQYGASTFIWVSPFSNKTLDLIDKVKEIGFDLIEICVEDP